MSFSRLTHLLIFLSLETLTSIIRTCLPILEELIKLVKSVINFLSQMTFFRWLTFLIGSQTVILLFLLFWISFFFFDAIICSTMAFPPLGISGHVTVAVSTYFPSNSQRDAPFHHIVYSYSYADWEGLHIHWRDVP